MATDQVVQNSAMRRKLAVRKPEGAQESAADRSLRLALARAAQDEMVLPLEVSELTEVRRSLSELLELPPERGLIAMLEGPGMALGIIVLAQPVLATMIEMQTMGRLSPTENAPRKPTRTDAAMVAGFIDRVLRGLEGGLEEEPEISWAGGFNYASFLADPRPLGLLLEDVPYRVFQIQVTLAGGARRGEVLLALPAEGRARQKVAPVPDLAAARAFQADLAAQVQAVQSELGAVLHRVTVPLSAVMGLQVGDSVPLPMAALERVVLEGLDGRRLAEGRLGQNNGMRAVRLMMAEPEAQVIEVERRLVSGSAG